jgi:uncharacterized protein GlcG (DUF336 family)
MRNSILAATASCIALASWQAASAVEKAPTLTLDVAQKLVAGCQAKATEKGWKMNIAIVDAGANLVAFERMDGAFLGSVMISENKAETSAKFPFPTRMLAELAFGKDMKGGGMVPGIAMVPGVITFAGGLPIKTADGAHIGGIGVSGGTADQDEECAQAGLDGAKDVLK